MKGVIAAAPEVEAQARELAAALSVPMLPVGTDSRRLPAGDIVLLVTGGDPCLQETGTGAPGPVSVGFRDAALAHRRRGGQNELLGRAVGWRATRAPAVLDATAGFGRDAFVLADLGCRVTLCERQPVMATLLMLALQGAAESGDPWLAEVISRMQLVPSDATAVDVAQLRAVDVIYLDPMFAQPRKTAPGKAMQVLQRLTGEMAGEQSDASALLDWALAQPVSRVVVKRPRRAPELGSGKPSHKLQGRAVRFDVYAGTLDGSGDGSGVASGGQMAGSQADKDREEQGESKSR